MEHNRTSTKSVPFFVAPVSEPEFGQDLVWWGTCMTCSLNPSQKQRRSKGWQGASRAGAGKCTPVPTCGQPRQRQRQRSGDQGRQGNQSHAALRACEWRRMRERGSCNQALAGSPKSTSSHGLQFPRDLPHSLRSSYSARARWNGANRRQLSMFPSATSARPTREAFESGSRFPALEPCSDVHTTSRTKLVSLFSQMKGEFYCTPASSWVIYIWQWQCFFLLNPGSDRGSESSSVVGSIVDIDSAWKHCWKPCRHR